ncbi:hypothetical protein JCM14076_06400 [Methylosoma difficile]
MTKLSEHFDSKEFACRCGCGESDVNPTLIKTLELIRESIDLPIKVISGRRCAKHNRAVGGAKNSQHKLGNAADIQVAGLSPKEVHAIIEQIHKEKKAHIGGLGLYRTFVHIDMRPGVARW